MAKPETKKPEVPSKPSNPVLSTFTFRPTCDDSFRMVRAKGVPLWAVQVTRVTDGKHVFTVVLDPPDTLDSIQRKAMSLMQEVERR